MQQFKPFLRILLPSLLCTFIIYMIKDKLFYYPLSFGLIIGLINWDFHKYKPIIGVLLSVLVSYISFFTAYFSIGLTGEAAGSIFNVSSDDAKGTIAFIISPFIIAPILVFLLYTLVFEIPKTRLTIFVIILSLVLLVSQNYFYYYADSLSIDVAEYTILNSYTVWQIIMALALQIMIHQKTIKTKNSKSGNL